MAACTEVNSWEHTAGPCDAAASNDSAIAKRLRKPRSASQDSQLPAIKQQGRAKQGQRWRPTSPADSYLIFLEQMCVGWLHSREWQPIEHSYPQTGTIPAPCPRSSRQKQKHQHTFSWDKLEPDFSGFARRLAGS